MCIPVPTQEASIFLHHWIVPRGYTHLTGLLGKQSGEQEPFRIVELICLPLSACNSLTPQYIRLFRGLSKV